MPRLAHAGTRHFYGALGAFASRSLNETPRQFSSALVDRGRPKNAKSVRELREFRGDFVEEIPLG
jgi:hypothetical protein